MEPIAWSLLWPSLLRPGGLWVASGPRGLLAVEFLRDGAEGAKAKGRASRWVRPGGAEEAVQVGGRGSVRSPRGPAVAHLRQAIDELEAYFSGSGSSFRVACDPDGHEGSFAGSVWRALREVPSGVLTTYGELATRVGRPGAARAVGQAVGRNPFPIVVPCHRVVGQDRRLTGFSSGLGLKVLLLRHEGVAVTEGAELARCRVAAPTERESLAQGVSR